MLKKIFIVLSIIAYAFYVLNFATYFKDYLNVDLMDGREVNRSFQRYSATILVAFGVLVFSNLVNRQNKLFAFNCILTSALLYLFTWEIPFFPIILLTVGLVAALTEFKTMLTEAKP